MTSRFWRVSLLKSSTVKTMANRTLFHRWLCAIALWLVFTLSGCRQDPVIQPVSGGMDQQQLDALRNMPLRVLAVGPSEWAEEMEVLYSGQFDGKIEVQSQPLDEFDFGDEQHWKSFDVLIVPPWVVTPLALQRQLLELRPESLEQLQERSLLLLDRRIGRLGKSVFGISLGMPMQGLVVDANFKWDDASPIVRDNITYELWHKSAVAKNGTELRFAESLASGGAARALLRRGSTYARSRTQISPFFGRADAKPNIDSPPFVQALREMQEEYGKHVSKLKSMDDGQLIQQVHEGNLTASIGAIGNLGSEKSDRSSVEVRLLPPPGSQRYYNQFNRQWTDRGLGNHEYYQLTGLQGRVACILHRTRKTESALKFLTILSNSPTAEKLAPLAEGLGPSKAQQLDQLELWFGRNYSAQELSSLQQLYQAANETQGSGVAAFPPVLGLPELIAELDQTVLAALESGQDPEAALAACSEKWRQIMETQGWDQEKKVLADQ